MSEPAPAPPSTGTPARSAPLALLAGVLGFSGVALGAFGAHGLEDLLEASGRTPIWEKAVLYHLVHAAALFAAAQSPRAPTLRLLAWCWGGGVAVFSGSLYLLCLTGTTWLGAITPIGGVAFLVGWGGVAVNGARGRFA